MSMNITAKHSVETLAARVTLEKGRVWLLEELELNSYYLDGAHQGFVLDLKQRIFSFDHHHGVVRMITTATCRQVWDAIFQGLYVRIDDRIVINDIDADTVLATWLLLHPERYKEERVAELVRRVADTDAHGPLYAPHWLYYQITPRRDSVASLDLLAEYLNLVTTYVDGALEERPAPYRKMTGYGYHPDRGWEPYEDLTDYGPYLVRILYERKPDGTYGYLIGKRSELVDFPIGPSHRQRPAANNADYREDTLLGQLALRELERNPKVTHNSNWGGATVVGGECRCPDGSGSIQRPEEVLALAKAITPA